MDDTLYLQSLRVQTGTDLVENSGAGQTVYTITADANDGGTISSYAIGGTDAGLLTVNWQCCYINCRSRL